MNPQHMLTVTIKDVSVDIILFTETFSNFYASTHTHSGHEFHFIADGTCELHIGTEKHLISKGNCYLISRGNFHHVKMISDNVCRISALIMPHNTSGRTKNATPFDFECFNSLPPFTEFEAGGNMKALLELLLSSLQSNIDDSAAESYINSNFTMILIELVRKLSHIVSTDSIRPEKVHEVPLRSDESRKNEILKYIARNLATASLSELAEIMHMSRRQVSRFLNDNMNDNFSGILREHRIEHAKSLISSSSYSLEEIAFLSGYNSYKGFHTAFCLYTGMNPQKFKETVAKNE